MIVTYPIFTQSIADAILMAQRQAKASGFAHSFLVKTSKVGNGSWEITLRLAA